MTAAATLKPFHAAAAAWGFLEKLGVSVQSAEVLPGGRAVVRCDYSPTLTRRIPNAEPCGRGAGCTHYRAAVNGVEVAWDEPESVRRRDTLRRILQRGRRHD